MDERSDARGDEAGGLEAELSRRIGVYLEQRGYELYEVTYRRERRGWVLRFTVDRVGGGLTVEEAVRLSREIGALIEADPALDRRLGGPYHLEVSSPGIFRELKTPRDLERAWGKRIRVRWRDEDQRVREASGILEAYGEGALRLRLADDVTVEIAEEQLLGARLDPELPFGHR